MIDVRRCERAMANLTVRGVPDTKGRQALIEEAIAMIQKDGAGAFLEERIGFKNYAAFGDQRCDCRYGTGPRHGYVVFGIGRNLDKRERVDLGADEIYLLECVRDFPGVMIEEYDGRGSQIKRILNLSDVITRRQKKKKEFLFFDGMIGNATVTQELAPEPPVEIVFDGPPGHDAGRFVEVEQNGRGIKFGEWKERENGFWVLQLPQAYAMIPTEGRTPQG